MVPRVLRSAVAFLPLVAAIAVLSSAPAEAHAAKKYALLVGVNKYEHANLPPLEYAVADVAELRDVLTRAGYEVVLLTADEAKAKKDTGLAPTRPNVETHLKALVKKFARGDTLVIGLAGHGLQFAGDEDGYFCTEDARPFKERTDTLVSVKWIYERLHQDAADGAKLLLVDACRSIVKVRGRGINADDVPAPPKGVGVLLSCAAGQTAGEGEGFGGGHGVFFHYVLEGLKGKARDDEGAVTWDSLRSYVKKQVPKEIKEQTPEEAGRLTGVPVLIDPAGLKGVVEKAGRKGGEEQVVDLGGGVKMKFCWVPQGEAQLGSTKAERQQVLKLIEKTEEPHWLAPEAEEVRGKFKTKGFWLAKYPVTQEQWRTVMGNNPSHFTASNEKIKEAGITDTSQFPVDTVSWNDCQEFVGKLNASVRVQTLLGRGKFVLPHEDEWEYACRGGKGNKRPFYFGDQLNGDLANCDGNYPYGTDAKGEFKGRTTKVGEYEAKARHPWGLCDMHGNVMQWCENKNKNDEDSYVIRGSSWHEHARDCRAARRFWNIPSPRYYVYGLRPGFRPD
jgi:formylglycine-generating enzyme required for sulfatase activity